RGRQAPILAPRSMARLRTIALKLGACKTFVVALFLIGCVLAEHRWSSQSSSEQTKAAKITQPTRYLSQQEISPHTTGLITGLGCTIHPSAPTTDHLQGLLELGVPKAFALMKGKQRICVQGHVYELGILKKVSETGTERDFEFADSDHEVKVVKRAANEVPLISDDEDLLADEPGSTPDEEDGSGTVKPSVPGYPELDVPATVSPWVVAIAVHINKGP
ncbi:hypothetical protein BaRGS_00014590, partial [Batillaria attramentaria]